jgi:hypothetical protein
MKMAGREGEGQVTLIAKGPRSAFTTDFDRLMEVFPVIVRQFGKIFWLQLALADDPVTPEAEPLLLAAKHGPFSIFQSASNPPVTWRRPLDFR